MTPAVLLEIARGPLVEEIQRGHLAIVDAEGTTLAALGDPEHAVAYWRSSAKPFQSMALVASGAADAFGFAAEDLAVCSASHNGEAVHISRVAHVLDLAGNTPGDLQCGAHPPYDQASAAALERAGTAPSALHSNCSGKHAGMLALARHLGAPTEGYRRPDHPVQRLILETVCRFTGLRSDEIVIGVDGCGVPCFGISVSRMALAFARVMRPDGLPVADQRAAAAVRGAMMSHPYLVAGAGRFDTDLMRIAGGRILVKGGASGVLCAGLERGVGIAVKLESGSRHLGSGAPAIVAALRALGAIGDAELADLTAHAHPVVRNVAGQSVGETRVPFALPALR
ncbi:MAG TPA: asparaginase [Candidatus Saccharimonadales bacterium]|nr:asparaginase [Candidatus Saccharimonadales bacterium]